MKITKSYLLWSLKVYLKIFIWWFVIFFIIIKFEEILTKLDNLEDVNAYQTAYIRYLSNTHMDEKLTPDSISKIQNILNQNTWHTFLYSGLLEENTWITKWDLYEKIHSYNYTNYNKPLPNYCSILQEIWIIERTCANEYYQVTVHNNKYEIKNSSIIVAIFSLLITFIMWCLYFKQRDNINQ